MIAPNEQGGGKAAKKRIKVALPALRTREDAERMMTDLALRVNCQRQAMAQRDAEVLAVNQKYASRLAELESLIEAETDALCDWAEANKDSFPKGMKSIALTNGTLGFRTGTPALALLSRKWNWAKVLEAVKRLLPNFIRNKPEVDKDAIIAQRDELAEFLPLVGVKVAQGESFFIEPKLTDTDARQVQKAGSE